MWRQYHRRVRKRCSRQRMAIRNVESKAAEPKVIKTVESSKDNFLLYLESTLQALSYGRARSIRRHSSLRSAGEPPLLLLRFRCIGVRCKKVDIEGRWAILDDLNLIGAGRCELHSGSLSQAPKCKQPPSQQNEISFEAPLGAPQERAIPRRTPQESTEQVNDWHRQAPYEHTISVLVPDVTHHDIAVRTMNVSRDLTVGLVDLGSILRLGSVSLI